MSILSALNPLSLITDIGSQLIDHFFPDPEEAQQHKLELAQLAQSGELKKLDAYTQLAVAQAEINKAEAASGNVFIAGWRPFIGWVCGAAFAYAFILQPLLTFVLSACGVTIGELPDLGISDMMPVLLGMLGLGGMRSFEKVKGAAGAAQVKG